MSASDGSTPGRPRLVPPAGGVKPPPRRAAALSYGGGTAPTVVAAGAGDAADRIEAIAREHDIPVTKDAPLAEALSRIPIDDEIPSELYRAVAEVLIWAHGIEIATRAEQARNIA